MPTISCLSDKPRLFPGFPQLCSSSLRVFSWQPTFDLSLESDPHSVNLSTKAPLVVGNVNRFLAGKCFSLKISVMNSLCFPFLAPVAEFPSEVLQLPTPLTPSLTVKGLPRCGNFSPSVLPPQGTGPHPEILCLFFIFFFWSTSF